MDFKTNGLSDFVLGLGRAIYGQVMKDNNGEDSFPFCTLVVAMIDPVMSSLSKKLLKSNGMSRYIVIENNSCVSVPNIPYSVRFPLYI